MEIYRVSLHTWINTHQYPKCLIAAHLVWVNGHPGGKPYYRYSVKPCSVGDRSGRQMVIGLWWMAHQDGVHLRIRSQNWLKYKLAVKTGSQRSDHYDSYMWPRFVNKSITVRQIDKLIDWWWRKFGWTQWSIRDKEESGIHKYVFVFKKLCCIEKEKQQWEKHYVFPERPSGIGSICHRMSSEWAETSLCQRR